MSASPHKYWNQQMGLVDDQFALPEGSDAKQLMKLIRRDKILWIYFEENLTNQQEQWQFIRKLLLDGIKYRIKKSPKTSLSKNQEFQKYHWASQITNNKKSKGSKKEKAHVQHYQSIDKAEKQREKIKTTVDLQNRGKKQSIKNSKQMQMSQVCRSRDKKRSKQNNSKALNSKTEGNQVEPYEQKVYVDRIMKIDVKNNSRIKIIQSLHEEGSENESYLQSKYPLPEQKSSKKSRSKKVQSRIKSLIDRDKNNKAIQKKLKKQEEKLHKLEKKLKQVSAADSNHNSGAIENETKPKYWPKNSINHKKKLLEDNKHFSKQKKMHYYDDQNSQGSFSDFQF